MKKCPKCKQYFSETPAISRRDNTTEICSYCGTKEALEDMEKALGWKKVNDDG